MITELNLANYYYIPIYHALVAKLNWEHIWLHITIFRWLRTKLNLYDIRWRTHTSAPPEKITRLSWGAVSLSTARCLLFVCFVCLSCHFLLPDSWEALVCLLLYLNIYSCVLIFLYIYLCFFLKCLFDSTPVFQVENIGTSTLIWKKDNRIIRWLDFLDLYQID